MKLKTTLLTLTALVALAGPSASPASSLPDGAQAGTASRPAANRPEIGAWGIDLTARDPAIAPGNGFFDHVNGTWYRAVQIAPDLPGAGVQIDIALRVQNQLRAIVEEAMRAPRNDNQRKIGDLFKSFMDEERIESLDAAPLQPALERIRSARTQADFAVLLGRGARGFGTSLFSMGIAPDIQGDQVYVPFIGIGGMGLPSRDYYLSDNFQAQRQAYADYAKRTFEMINWPNPEASARDVLAFETQIARATWPLEQQRETSRSYNPMTLAELQAYAPEFDWAAFFRTAGVNRTDRLIATQNTAIQQVARLLSQTSPETVKAWLALRLTADASPLLSRRFVDSQFAFARATVGTPQLPDRWKRALGTVDGTLGEAIGQEYVARHFPASSKLAVQEMVTNLQRAMRDRINNAAWMSPQTRAEALRKLDRQRVKIGYPDRWRDYSALQIDPQNLFANMERATEFNANFNYGRIGQPIDREEWVMTPQTLNAYFRPSANEVVFPAAFLQSPLFHPNADPAVNYGAIGGVIGHEISHGFDDQGRQFDADGRMRDWWTPQDAERFAAETAKLVAQYSGYEALPGVPVSGQRTLGENIGDQGGVRLALDAYHTSLGGRPAPVIDGYTGDQRLFMAWAQGWRHRLRDQMTQMLAAGDVHAPFRWRVDGTFRNFEEWHRAFNVRPGQALYLAPEQRANVW